MGTLFAKVIQVLKIMPLILYFTKGNKLKQEPIETDLFEDEDIRTLIKLLGTSSIMILTDLYTIETTPWSESNIESMILSGVIEKIE